MYPAFKDGDAIRVFKDDDLDARPIMTRAAVDDDDLASVLFEAVTAALMHYGVGESVVEMVKGEE